MRVRTYDPFLIILPRHLQGLARASAITAQEVGLLGTAVKDQERQRAAHPSCSRMNKVDWCADNCHPNPLILTLATLLTHLTLDNHTPVKHA